MTFFDLRLVYLMNHEIFQISDRRTIPSLVKNPASGPVNSEGPIQKARQKTFSGCTLLECRPGKFQLKN